MLNSSEYKANKIKNINSLYKQMIILNEQEKEENMKTDNKIIIVGFILTPLLVYLITYNIYTNMVNNYFDREGQDTL